MKNSKEAKVKQYLEEYLKDKPEDWKGEFLAKPIERQYSTIMGWKRRNEIKSKARGLNPADVIKHASALASMIELTENFTEKEQQKMIEALDAAKEKITNFQRIRDARRLRALERQQEEIQQQINRLRSAGVE